MLYSSFSHRYKIIPGTEKSKNCQGIFVIKNAINEGMRIILINK
jgi:hypothetical protein